MQLYLLGIEYTFKIIYKQIAGGFVITVFIPKSTSCDIFPVLKKIALGDRRLNNLQKCMPQSCFLLGNMTPICLSSLTSSALSSQYSLTSKLDLRPAFRSLPACLYSHSPFCTKQSLFVCKPNSNCP